MHVAQCDQPQRKADDDNAMALGVIRQPTAVQGAYELGRVGPAALPRAPQ